MGEATVLATLRDIDCPSYLHHKPQKEAEETTPPRDRAPRSSRISAAFKAQLLTETNKEAPKSPQDDADAGGDASPGQTHRSSPKRRHRTQHGNTSSPKSSGEQSSTMTNSPTTNNNNSNKENTNYRRSKRTHRRQESSSPSRRSSAHHHRRSSTSPSKRRQDGTKHSTTAQVSSSSSSPSQPRSRRSSATKEKEQSSRQRSSRTKKQSGEDSTKSGSQPMNVSTAAERPPDIPFPVAEEQQAMIDTTRVTLDQSEEQLLLEKSTVPCEESTDQLLANPKFCDSNDTVESTTNDDQQTSKETSRSLETATSSVNSNSESDKSTSPKQRDPNAKAFGGFTAQLKVDEEQKSDRTISLKPITCASGSSKQTAAAAATSVARKDSRGISSFRSRSGRNLTHTTAAASVGPTTKAESTYPTTSSSQQAAAAATSIVRKERRNMSSFRSRSGRNLIHTTATAATNDETSKKPERTKRQRSLEKQRSAVGPSKQQQQQSKQSDTKGKTGSMRRRGDAGIRRPFERSQSSKRMEGSAGAVSNPTCTTKNPEQRPRPSAPSNSTAGSSMRKTVRRSHSGLEGAAKVVASTSSRLAENDARTASAITATQQSGLQW